MNPMMGNVDRILRLGQILSLTGLSRSTIYRKVEEGSFPQQIKIAARCTGWRESEINRWISDPAGYSREQITE